MVTISKAFQDATVFNYLNSWLTNLNYSDSTEHTAGLWHGALAMRWALTASVSSDNFRRLAAGQDPHTGEQLIRIRPVLAKVRPHRAAWDATFSAPKTLSLTALVGGDQSLIAAHRHAVLEAIQFLEHHTHARLGGNTPPDPTGEWVAATFERDSARPVERFSAPQLHTHVLFFNLTRTADGKFHAIQERPIFKQQCLATAIYQARLAYELRRLGYAFELGKNHAPEISGYTPEYLLANSPRSSAITSATDIHRTQDRRVPQLREALAHLTRESESAACSPQSMRQLSQRLATQHGRQHEAIVLRALQHRGTSCRPNTSTSAIEAAEHGLSLSLDHLLRSSPTVTRTMLLLETLLHVSGAAAFPHVDAALRARLSAGALLQTSQPFGVTYSTSCLPALPASS